MVSMRTGLAAALALVLFSAAPAAALQFHERQTETADGVSRHILVSGDFEVDDDLRAFERAVRRHRAGRVTFSSPGGSIDKAMELGRLIRRLGLDTFQARGKRCASACSLAFMGGVERSADAETIGMHQSRFDYPNLDPMVAMARIQRLVADSIAYLNEMGVDPGVLELAYRAGTDEMHYFSAREMRRHRLVTPRADAPPLAAAEPGPAPPLLPRDRPFWAIMQQDALLYEEATGTDAPVAHQGRVIWSILREAPDDDLPAEPVIRADIEFPEPGLSARLAIRRNADAEQPSSHLIDILFAAAESFAGDGIAAIRNLAFKHGEADTGEPLLAAPEKITDTLYLIALDGEGPAVETNLALLRDRAWIDLPVTYANGARALLTLEKGPTGTEVFDQVLQAWKEAEGTEVAEVAE